MFIPVARGWPDFTEPLVERIGAMLGADAAINTILIRRTLDELVGEMRVDTENAALQETASETRITSVRNRTDRSAISGRSYVGDLHLGSIS